jgi:hypothetical protein
MFTKRSDVIHAIDALLEDLRTAPESWENATLESYIEAMQAWLESSARKQDEPASWDLIVQMLQAAKICE